MVTVDPYFFNHTHLYWFAMSNDDIKVTWLMKMPVYITLIKGMMRICVERHIINKIIVDGILRRSDINELLHFSARLCEQTSYTEFHEYLKRSFELL